MNCLEITKELKNDIEINQNQLQNAIRNHQDLLVKVKDSPDKKECFLKEIAEVEERIRHIGFQQKNLLDRLREEYKAHHKTAKSAILKTGLEERKFPLSNSIGRARKQNFFARNRSPPINSHSDDSEHCRSPPKSPELRPTNPEDVGQSTFLGYFKLATHAAYGDMQKKRAERKRRSTANPHFLYGNKGWDFLGPPVKKKRGHFLIHPPSPPNTRGRRRQELAITSFSKSPPIATPVATNGNCGADKSAMTNGSTSVLKSEFKPILPPSMLSSIPNLPSELVIERIEADSVQPDQKICIVCKQPGALSRCERCSNGYHLSCHNRPFARTPTQCPKCLLSSARTSAASSSSSSSSSSPTSSSSSASMTISLVHPPDMTEKLHLKKVLREKQSELSAELTQLQNRHSELTIAVRNQEIQKEQTKLNSRATQAKVNQLLNFIETVKNFSVPELQMSTGGSS